MTDLPDYYFRIRENGAAVFRLDDDRQRRLDMTQIAVVNIKNGEVRAQGSRSLSAEDHAAIGAWMAARREELARREMDEIRRTVESLNAAAQWAQARAEAEDLEAVTDDLLLAMHDLRSVLVRKKAERLQKTRGAAPD